jgi:predicted phosphodiesterase
LRIALISDLHGNDVALRAALAQIARVGVDRTVCLGDVATLGPHPERVLDTLRDIACPVILGNHDEFLLDEAVIRRYTKLPEVLDAVAWCRDRLQGEHLDYVRTFVPQLEIPLGDPGASLFLFHGSPRSHMEDVLATTPPEQLDTFLDGRVATVMAGGHTHVQMLRQHRGILLVNPGSVGMPFREYVEGRRPTILPHAEFAIVSYEKGAVDVALHRVPLDKGELRAAVEPSDIPLRDVLLDQYA